jgi:hypothetical protein
VKIKRVSLLSGKEREMDLPVTDEQMMAWQNGKLAQNAFPNLTPSEREFIMTGVTDEEWETLKEPE